MRLIVCAALLLLVGVTPAVSASDPPDVGPATPGHIDVFVPEFMGCTWAGSYKPVVDTPLVTVWVFTCDPPT